MGGSSSSSATSTTTRDGRVAVDGQSLGISSEGDVSVHIVPDEAFELGELSVHQMAEVAENAGANAVDVVEEMRDLAEFSTSEFGGLANRAIGTIADLAEQTTADSRDSLERVTGTFANALARSQAAERSESAQLGEQFIKIGLPVAALAFVVSAWGK